MREEIEELFKSGDLLRAGRLCKRSGYALEEFRSSIEHCTKKLWHKRQAGIVVSFILDTGFDVGVDPAVLLKGIFDSSDWHGFLKSAHRMKRRRGFENEIDTAIENLIEKKQLADAEGWRKKFQALRDLGA